MGVLGLGTQVGIRDPASAGGWDPGGIRDPASVGGGIQRDPGSDSSKARAGYLRMLTILLKVATV